MNKLLSLLVVISVCFQNVSIAQGEANIWYFGNNAGLSFSTNPPTVLSNGVLVTSEGCASISDPSGNLLFYTDGSTVWNSSHLIMANGTGLFGNSSTTQSALIVKQPGSAIIYHVFTLLSGGGNTLSYSTVDMSLASGSGSVITKNVFLANNMTEKMTGAKHCNGSDYWVITHEGSTNNFKSFLVTAAGVSLSPVVSATGPLDVGGLGTMKSSPNGKMLATCLNSVSSFTETGEVFSFDQTTGQVTFQYSISTGLTSYGCEFSPDGTKLYFACYYPTSNLSQFDLCAGSASAVAASQYTMPITSLIAAMQVAPNGKVYCARLSMQSLGVINNPNLSGPLCNFVETGLSIAPGASELGLPNFAIAYTPTLAPFTYTLPSCSKTATFNAPAIAQTSTVVACTSNGYSITGLQWNFGDPASGITNTSTLINPQHLFTATGTYTTTFILYYSCGKSNDTLRQVVNITNSAPSLSVAGTFTICKGEKRVYTVSGANTYSWSNALNTTTVSLSPTITTSYSVSGNTTNNSCVGSKTFTITVKACTDLNELNEAEAQVEIYPNPVNDLLHITNTLLTKILFLNQHGEILIEKTFEPGQNTLDISSFEDGLYFMRSINTAGTSVRRIIKRN